MQTGATDIDECSCNVGYYAVQQGASASSSSSDGEYLGNATAGPHDSELLVCQACGVGANCSIDGLTTRTLPLLSGYWRAKLTSQSIYRCKDASSGDSGCVGGTESLCKPTLTGATHTCSTAHTPIRVPAI